MTRSEFVKMCGILGITLPLYSHVSTASSLIPQPPVKFKGKVLIIGAGAAGLSAAYLLKQQGIGFQILEASGSYGGRIKHNRDFVDFPIPLGA